MFDVMSYKAVLGIVAGAVVGVAYSRLSRCSTGTCPITSNWWVAGLYGAAIGLLMTTMSFAGSQTQPSGTSGQVKANSTAPATAPASQEGKKIMIKHVESEADFDNQVLHSNKPVLVDFFATWCGPCRLLVPIFEQLSSELAGRAEIVKVDVDKVRDLAARYKIMSIPTVMLFDHGKVVQTFVGVRPKADYLNAVQQTVAK